MIKKINLSSITRRQTPGRLSLSACAVTGFMSMHSSYIMRSWHPCTFSLSWALSWVGLCPPKNHTLKSQPSVLQDMTLFGNRVFTEVVKVRSLGWALIQHDWCYKKGKRGHRDTYRRKTMWRDREKTAIYKPRREAWNGSFPPSPQKEPTLLHLDLELLASRTVRQYISAVKPPSLWCFVPAALAN